ncbi:Coatomer subunit beta'-3 [Zea mays]|nr:Coatomer subunit beta'-3 [Zea mays]ONM19738.1 Coatomer subunit beta'-3 [Zea mays]ONM19739.1 Coatomer subunit beta'-3 [Zea mays]
MDDQENEDQALEHILTDANAEPVMLSYAFLKSITNDFSCVIGRGGFGVVYKGYLHNGKTVAVKQLSKTDDFSEKQFHDELMCLIRVKHRNIVRFLGYCSDTQQKMADFNGRFVLADIRRRFLCFEFVPNKSLLHYLKEQSTGRDWKTRYQLIEGICQGLWYLHHEEHINHLDLKPENILLDDDMVPKISDFGLSRRFSGELNVIITENICGTLGYIAPEYLSKGEISFKADIFSLGIIIKKILMGSNDLSDFEKWHESQDVHCPQLNRCIQISQLCLEDDQHKRPTIGCIIDMLNDMKTTTTETIVSPGFGHSRNNSGSSEEYVYLQ